MTKIRRAALAALVLGLCASIASAAKPPAPGPSAGSQPLIAVLCYHHLSNDPKARLDTVSPEFLRSQIRASKAAGWTFMSLGELMALEQHPERLPPRTMVLTFDDGYKSFVTEALPILREEKVKATLAVITSFVGKPQAGMPPLMSWAQIREAERSGLVEIASHSHALHRYETNNPYRDTGPSVGTRRYLLKEARYETRDEYRARVREDLLESRRVLEKELGHPVPLLVWPYGERNQMAEALARESGFKTTLNLAWREVTGQDLDAGRLPRVMVVRTMDFTRDDLAWLREPSRPVRAAQVDLDDLYDPDPAEFRRNVDALVARVQAIGATHVFLQACADPDGNGMLRRAYFMNHQMPVLADVWSMVAAKLAQERIKVWIRAPSMNLSWVWEQRPEWRIPFTAARASDKTPWYFRVSPNLPEVRRAAIDFFADLAVYLPIDGVLFDDDAYMLPGESLNGSLAADPGSKAKAIQALLEDVQGVVRAWRPECKFGRNIYAPVVERNGIHPEFTQDYGRSLGDFDLTVVMAYARMEGHRRDAVGWTGSLASRAVRRWRPLVQPIAGATQGAKAAPFAPVMLKFQSYDWETKAWVPTSELEALVAQAKKAGVVNLGLYPVHPVRGEVAHQLLDGPAPGGIAVDGPAPR